MVKENNFFLDLWSAIMCLVTKYRYSRLTWRHIQTISCNKIDIWNQRDNDSAIMEKTTKNATYYFQYLVPTCHCLPCLPNQSDNLQTQVYKKTGFQNRFTFRSKFTTLIFSSTVCTKFHNFSGLLAAKSEGSQYYTTTINDSPRIPAQFETNNSRPRVHRLLGWWNSGWRLLSEQSRFEPIINCWPVLFHHNNMPPKRDKQNVQELLDRLFSGGRILVEHFCFVTIIYGRVSKPKSGINMD